VQIEWLEGLESRVREAASRLTELREQNVELAARVEELEIELAAATGVGDGGGEEIAAARAELAEERRQSQELKSRVEELEQRLAAGAAESSDWEAERQEVRGRVETLTRRLEELLGV
jgi:chromosome segregation ATPase